MYRANDYAYLLGISGFSDELLKNHFALYESYVKNTNKLTEELDALLAAGKTDTPEYAEIKRRFGWEFNGMRLHEYYFGNLTKDKGKPGKDSGLYKKITASYGNFENWEKDFRATGAMRGIGWAILYYDKETDWLANFWINEHDAGHPAGCAPLLVMDVFEHAYMLDYGMNRADYIETFFKIINWEIVEKRFEKISK